jgi:fructose-1,6-bisphosphatase
MKLYILTINRGFYDDNETIVKGVFDSLANAINEQNKIHKKILDIQAKSPKNQFTKKYWEYRTENREYLEFIEFNTIEVELNKPI